VVAFLGLTHYAAGLDRARQTVAGPVEPAAVEPAALESVVAAADGGRAIDASPTVDPGKEPAPPVSPWVLGAEPHREEFRWVTIPMLLLIAFAVFIAIAGLIAAA